VLNIIIAQGTVTAFFANFIAFVLMASRVAFALSFDRLMPTRLADVNPRTHSPVYAMLLIIALVGAWVALLVYTPFSTVLGILLLVITSIFVFGSAAAMILPYRRKELYDASPKAFTGYLFGIPTTSVLGFLSMCGCLYMVIEIAVHPAYTGGYHWRSILVIGVCATLGLVLYGISSFRMKQRGFDLKLAMEELPPE
jgi:amino acid transporter